MEIIVVGKFGLYIVDNVSAIWVWKVFQKFTGKIHGEPLSLIWPNTISESMLISNLKSDRVICTWY